MAGYMIVSYLVERMDCRLIATLQKFVRVRPPDIYERNFLTQLCNRYNNNRTLLMAVKAPDWCRDDKVEKRKKKKQRKTKAKSTASFKNPLHHAPEIPGVYLATEHPRKTQFQQRLHRMCGWQETGFLGYVPVPMDVNNKELLARKPYRVSWKSNGTRYVMLIDDVEDIFCSFIVILYFVVPCLHKHLGTGE